VGPRAVLDAVVKRKIPSTDVKKRFQNQYNSATTSFAVTHKMPASVTRLWITLAVAMPGLGAGTPLP
jgi:hypothetical protein